MKRMVVLSGGQDSVTCLYWALARSESVVALTFDYGQRHRRELDCAARISKLAGVPQQVVNLGPLFTGSSPLTDLSREVEHYQSADTLPGGLEDTFVPGRNMLFLAVAASRAYVENCDTLVIGVSQEDFGGYPDCRESFIKSMENTVAEALDRRIPIEAPLLFKNKRETVDMAAALNGCWEALALSHTRYEGAFPPCGECHSCLLRSRGFKEAGRTDPLLEEAPLSRKDEILSDNRSRMMVHPFGSRKFSIHFRVKDRSLVTHPSSFGSGGATFVVFGVIRTLRARPGDRV